jgi:endonuclease YncB( thermonuclease family)
MKTTFPPLLLLFLTGCGEPQTVTQLDVPAQQPAAVTTPPVTSEQVTAGFAGKVIKVVDGDTIDVLTDDKETIRIRFSGIDTPERGQPFGNNATRMLKELVAGEIVRIVPQGDDRYDRRVGEIYHDGTLINLALVEAGLAWHYVKYAADRTDLAEAKRKARADNADLWAGN